MDAWSGWLGLGGWWRDGCPAKVARCRDTSFGRHARGMGLGDKLVLVASASFGPGVRFVYEDGPAKAATRRRRYVVRVVGLAV